jgi:hypothetical protein
MGNEKIEKAYKAGYDAVKTGKPQIPCHNEDLNALLKGVKVGEAAPILKSFIRGGHDALGL